MLALVVADELFARLHPHYFRSEQIIRMADLESRASCERRETMTRQDGWVVAWLREIVQEAADAGDLSFAPPMTVGSVAFAIFSLAVGTHSSMLNFPHVLRELEVASPLITTRENMQALLDGFGWRPFRSEWDYAGTYRRIVQEVFADECRRAGLA